MERHSQRLRELLWFVLMFIIVQWRSYRKPCVHITMTQLSFGFPKMNTGEQKWWPNYCKREVPLTTTLRANKLYRSLVAVVLLFGHTGR